MDGEFPGVGGSDGNGRDDEEEAKDDEFPDVGVSVDEDGVGSCSGAVVARLNLSTKTLSLSKPITMNSLNQSLIKSSFIFLLFF